MWRTIQSKAYSWGVFDDSFSPSTNFVFGIVVFTSVSMRIFCTRSVVQQVLLLYAVLLCVLLCCVLLQCLRLRCELLLSVLVYSLQVVCLHFCSALSGFPLCLLAFRISLILIHFCILSPFALHVLYVRSVALRFVLICRILRPVAGHVS